MKLQVKKGSTDVSLYVLILDSSSSVGAGLTGLAFNTSSLVAYFVRPLGSATALTLATQTVTGAHSDGGFVQVDSTNMPGIYRLDLSDTIISSGVNSVVVMLKGAANMMPLVLEIQLVSYDPNDSAALGLTLVPANVTQFGGSAGTFASGRPEVNTSHIAGSAVSTSTAQIGVNAVQAGGTAWGSGAITSGVFASGAIDAAAIAADAIGASELAAGAASEIATAVRTELTTELGRVDVAVSTRLAPTVAARTLDVSAGGEAGVDWANIGSPTTTNNLSGTTVKTATDVEADTQDIQARLPAALVSGRIDASVGAMAADVVTASAIATDAIGAAELAASAITEIQSGLSTLDAAGVRTAVGLASANLDTQLAAIQADTDNLQTRIPAALVSGRIDASVGAMATDVITATAIATDAIGSAELAASAITEIQSGLSTLDAAGVRAAVGLASANLDTQLSTIDDFLDTEVAAIKAKTDLIPASPAAVGSAMTLTSGERDSIAAALLDLAAGIETNRTVRQGLRLMLAALAGKLSGAATTTVAIRDTNDSVDRISATVDSNGNRTAVTLNAS